MNKIYQQTELSYSRPSIKDAVIMADLMNSLQFAIAKNKVVAQYSNMPREERGKYKSIYSESVIINREKLESVYNILQEIGFTATEEPEVFELELKEDAE